MPDTGFLFPSSTGFSTAYGGSNEYTSPSNAYADDGNYATRVDTDGSYHFQSYGNFGFSLPAGVTILGIEVVRKGKSSVGAIRDGIGIYNIDSDTIYGDEAFWNTTESEHTTGGATELFGFSWTDASFADGSFYVVHSTGGGSTGRTMSLNSIKVKVYYEIPTPSPSISDTPTITESVTITTSIPGISLSDSQGITESIETLTNQYFASIVDTLTISENDDPVNIFGVRTIVESPIVTEDLQITTIRYHHLGRPSGTTQRLGV